MSEQPATSQRVTAAEAAAILGVSTTTIRRMVKRGELEGERVHRPQGTAFVVTLPADAPHAAGNAAPTRQAGGGVARGNAAPGGQLAAWSETFLVPLVAALERSQETIRDQAETIGRQSERVASLEIENGRLMARVVALTAPQTPVEASTAPDPLGPTTEPSGRWWRPWAPWLLGLLAIVAAVVLVALPK